MKKASSRNRKKAPKKQRKERCTSLLVIDQKPFLKKALSKCKRLRKELNKKQSLLDDFENKDRHTFDQWMRKTFESEFAQIHQLEQSVNSLSFILTHLSSCSMCFPDKVVDMHKELFERLENGTLHEFVPPNYRECMGGKDTSSDEDDDWDDEDDDDWDDEDDDEDDEDDDDWDDESEKDFFEEFFGRGMGGNNKKNFEFGFSTMQTSERNQHELKLKKCYRALAKRLHPDHSTLDESFRNRYWNEIQEAYKSGDLEALLRIEAICDLDDQEPTVQLGLARLNDIANYHLSHIQPIRHALRYAKKDIAFGFVQKGPTQQIRKSVKYELADDLDELEAEIEYMKGCANEIFRRFTPKPTVHASQKSTKNQKPKAKKNVPEEDDRQLHFF